MQMASSLDIISWILSLKTIAVVGCSPKPERPSHGVARYLQVAGYKIIPVNPGHERILGEKCYPNLSEIPEKVDVVDIFRRSEEVLPVVKEAIKILGLENNPTWAKGERILIQDTYKLDWYDMRF